MQKVNVASFRPRDIFTICILLAGLVLVNHPALAQDSSQLTTTGTVVSSGSNTMVVKDSANRYALFVFDKATVKPATLAPGSMVRVFSTQTDDPQVRLASVVQAIEPGAASVEPDIVPESIRNVEHAINRDVRKFHFGVQGGMALDPELADIGIHATFGPFFSNKIAFRPSIDYGFGEVTRLFEINADVVYNMSSNPGARRSFYFGGGPQFNFADQNFTHHDFGFSDFHYSTALNIVLGLRSRNGLFTELKTSVWAEPAPIVRLLVGYTF